MSQREELDRIYREHFAFVWRSLRRLGVPERDLPDVVQDVFLIAHARLHAFERRSKVSTWLYGICFRVVSDRRRRSPVAREVLDEAAGCDAYDTGAEVSSVVERKQARRLLELMLDELPLDQRAVFVAFELDGMGGEEIAELFGIPLGTVWSRLRLAREAFRRGVQRLRARERFALDDIGGVG